MSGSGTTSRSLGRITPTTISFLATSYESHVEARARRLLRTPEIQKAIGVDEAVDAAGAKRDHHPLLGTLEPAEVCSTDSYERACQIVKIADTSGGVSRDQLVDWLRTDGRVPKHGLLDPSVFGLTGTATPTAWEVMAHYHRLIWLLETTGRTNGRSLETRKVLKRLRKCADDTLPLVCPERTLEEDIEVDDAVLAALEDWLGPSLCQVDRYRLLASLKHGFDCPQADAYVETLRNRYKMRRRRRKGE